MAITQTTASVLIQLSQAFSLLEMPFEDPVHAVGSLKSSHSPKLKSPRSDRCLLVRDKILRRNDSRGADLSIEQAFAIT